MWMADSIAIQCLLFYEFKGVTFITARIYIYANEVILKNTLYLEIISHIQK